MPTYFGLAMWLIDNGNTISTNYFSYADDLKLVTPSVYALHQIAHICDNYAKRYDIYKIQELYIAWRVAVCRV